MAEQLAKKTRTQFDLVPDSITNLGMGAPSDELLKKCTQLLKNAAKHKMVRKQVLPNDLTPPTLHPLSTPLIVQEQPDSYTLFQYGPEIGDRRYREAVAKLLTEGYQSPVNV